MSGHGREVGPNGRPICTRQVGTMRCISEAVWWVTGRPTCHQHLAETIAIDVAWLQSGGARRGHVLHVEPIGGGA